MKRNNPFFKYLTVISLYGGIVNFVDEPGGTVGGDSNSIEVPVGSQPSSSDPPPEADPPKTDPPKIDPPKVDPDPSKSFDPKRFDDLDEKINGLIKVLTDKKTNSGDDKGGLSSLEHDDLVEMWQDDPKGFLSKLTAEIEQSAINKVTAETASKRFDESVEKTINSYADANPDFEEKWDKGEIQDFIDKNPGHNALSAHMMLTIAEKIEAAKKEGYDEAVKNFRTKKGSQVLNGGPSIPHDQMDAALKEPSKFGGRAAVIAKRAGLM